MIDVERLLIQLGRAGDGWMADPHQAESHLRGLCRQAAAAIRQIQANPPAPDDATRRYIGMILKEVGERLAPDA